MLPAAMPCCIDAAHNFLDLIQIKKSLRLKLSSKRFHVQQFPRQPANASTHGCKESGLDARRRPELVLEQFLPYRIKRLGERISVGLSRVYGRDFGISPPEWRVLVWLMQFDELTARDISGYASVDKATVSRAVQRLEERGLLARAPLPEDQRVQLLSLTARGDELMSELLPRVFDWEVRLLAPLSAHDHRDLLSLLDKLERQLEQVCGSAPDLGAAGGLFS